MSAMDTNFSGVHWEAHESGQGRAIMYLDAGWKPLTTLAAPTPPWPPLPLPFLSGKSWKVAPKRQTCSFDTCWSQRRNTWSATWPSLNPTRSNKAERNGGKAWQILSTLPRRIWSQGSGAMENMTESLSTRSVPPSHFRVLSLNEESVSWLSEQTHKLPLHKEKHHQLGESHLCVFFCVLRFRD